MQDQQHDIQNIIDGINDAQNVLSSKYIDDQIRTFYESELAHFTSLLNQLTYNTKTGTWHKKTYPKLNAPLF